MPTVKVTRHGQITIPAKLRREMDITEGDYLQVKIKDDEIVLKPQELVDSRREKAWDKLKDLLDGVHAKNPDLETEEVQQEILKAIQKVREKAGKG